MWHPKTSGRFVILVMWVITLASVAIAAVFTIDILPGASEGNTGLIFRRFWAAPAVLLFISVVSTIAWRLVRRG